MPTVALRSLLVPLVALVTLLACNDNANRNNAPPDLAPSTPLVGEALVDSCAGGRPHDNGVPPGNDLHKRTLSEHPNALCNDGTPAILYVRRASQAAATNRWVIHMQAGGSCSSYDVCADRWCGRGAYTADKMTSKFAPSVMEASGVLARNGINDFGPANQVMIYYCSSDSWWGQRSDAVLTDPDGVGPSFRVHFRGHDILEAAATVLLAGVTSDDGMEVLPPLSQATQVLFSGSSAGATGLTASLDWWASKVPSAQSFGIFDGAFFPVEDDIDDATIKGKYTNALQVSWATTRVELYNTFADASCLAHHTGADAYLCGLNSHVQLNHVTTPFLTRQDLTDPVQFNALSGLGMTLEQYAAWTQKGVARLKTVKTSGEEATDVKKAPGSHVSDCGQHIVMLSSPWFGVAQGMNASVDSEAGMATTLHDALLAWGTGTAPVHVQDTHPSTKSTCAATTNDQ